MKFFERSRTIETRESLAFGAYWAERAAEDYKVALEEALKDGDTNGARQFVSLMDQALGHLTHIQSTDPAELARSRAEAAQIEESYARHDFSDS